MLTDNTHTTLIGLKVELQISLLGGADGPLMYLAHSRSDSLLIIIFPNCPRGKISWDGELQIELKTSFSQSGNFDIQFGTRGCHPEILFLRIP